MTEESLFRTKNVNFKVQYGVESGTTGIDNLIKNTEKGEKIILSL